MNVTRNDALASKLLSEMMEEISEPERKGQHPSITDLIDCLTKTYYNALPSNNLQPTDKTKLFFLTGLGLERALLVKRKENPTYGVTDGIHWHVDSLDEGLLELKSTRAGNKGPEGISPRHIKQIKGYLKANDLTEVDLAIIHIIQPDFVVWHIKFEHWELNQFWEWLKERRDVWNRAVEIGEAPKAFTYNEEWECRDCVFKVLCDINKMKGM